MSSLLSSRDEEIYFSSSNDKYGSTMEVSMKDLYKKVILDYHSLISNFAENNNILALIFSVIQLIQISIPSFLINSSILYSKDALNTFLNICSVFTNIVPINVKDDYFYIYVSAYILLTIILFTFLILKSIHFKRTTRIHQGLVNFLYYFICGPYNLIQIFLSSNLGKSIGIQINDGRYNASFWFVVVLVLFFLILNVSIFHSILFVNLSFTSHPLHCFSSYFYSFFLISNVFTNSFSNLVIYTGRSYQIAFILILMFVYLSLFSLNLFLFQFLNNFLSSFVFTVYTLSFLSSLHTLINLILVNNVHFLSTVIYFILILIFTPIYLYLTKFLESKLTRMLDLFLEAPEKFDEIFPHFLFVLPAACIAFKKGHGCMSNWKFFEAASTRFTKSKSLIMMWSRFISSCSDDIRTLIWIGNKLSYSSKVFSPQFTLSTHITSVLRYRNEMNTLSFKKQLNICEHYIEQYHDILVSFWEAAFNTDRYNIQNLLVKSALASERTKDFVEDILFCCPNNLKIINLYIEYLRISGSNSKRVIEWTYRRHQLKNNPYFVDDIFSSKACEHFPDSMIACNRKSSVSFVNPNNGNMKSYSDIHEDASINSLDNDKYSMSDNIIDSVENMKTSEVTLSVRSIITLLCTVTFIIVPFIIIYMVFSINDFIEISSIIESINTLAMELSFCPTISIKYLYDSVFGLYNDYSNYPDLIQEILSRIEDIYEGFKGSKHQYPNSSLNQQYFELLYTVNIQLPWIDEAGNGYNVSYVNQSIDTLIKTIMLNCVDISNVDTDAEAMLLLNSSLDFYNMFNSRYELPKQLSLYSDFSTSVLFNYIEDKGHFFLLFYAISVIVILSISVLLLLYLRYLINSKIKLIEKCYLMIPKYVIKEILQTCRKNGFYRTTNTDNIDYLDSSSFEYHKDLTETFDPLFMITSLVMFSCFMYVIFIGAYLCHYYKRTKIFLQFVPYLTTLSSVGYSISDCLCALYTLTLIDNNISILGRDRTELYSYLSTYFNTLLTNLEYVLHQSSHRNYSFERSYSPADIFLSYNKYIPNISLVSLYSSLPVLGQMEVFQMIFLSYVNQANYTKLDLVNQFENQETTIFFDYIYDKHIKLFLNDFNQKVTSYKGSLITTSTIILLIYYIIMLITIFWVVMFHIYLKRRIILLIKPLTTCPPDLVMRIAPIMNIIFGKSSHTSERHSVNKIQVDNILWDDFESSIIITDRTYNIIQFNKSAQEKFRNLEFNVKLPDYFDDNTVIFENITNSLNNISTSQLPEIVEIGGSTFNLNILFQTKKGYVAIPNLDYHEIISIVFLLVDITEKNQIIQAYISETQKVENALLNMIPKEVIPYYHNANSSTFAYSIQTVSVCYIQLINLQGLNDNNSPSDLISTYCNIISMLDEILSSYANLVRITPLNTCYVVAGGVFNNQNVSVETFTRETVLFALEAIDAIRKINAQYKTSINPHIAINVDGPVVAGLVNVDTPFFDVYGYGISLAMMLSRKVNPYVCCITRHVYELIFGPEFSIKESNKYDIEESTVQTYSVTLQG